MDLQTLLDESDLNMTIPQIKAFFLGALLPHRPMLVETAINELLTETHENKEELKIKLKELWEHLKAHLQPELKQLFVPNEDLLIYLERAKTQLDSFLTAYALSGYTVETIEDDDLADLLDELEETVLDLDEFLADEEHPQNEALELKELLIETWEDFVQTHLGQ